MQQPRPQRTRLRRVNGCTTALLQHGTCSRSSWRLAGAPGQRRGLAAAAAAGWRELQLCRAAADGAGLRSCSLQLGVEQPRRRDQAAAAGQEGRQAVWRDRRTVCRALVSWRTCQQRMTMCITVKPCTAHGLQTLLYGHSANARHCVVACRVAQFGSTGLAVCPPVFSELLLNLLRRLAGSFGVSTRGVEPVLGCRFRLSVSLDATEPADGTLVGDRPACTLGSI